MPIVKTFELKADVDQAQKNLDEINETLEVQDEIVNKLQNDLANYEAQLKKTSKTDLAGRKRINDQINKTKQLINEERLGIKNNRIERKQAVKDLEQAKEATADYSGAVSIADRATGGLISRFGFLTKAIGGATKGMKLFRVALISTGIGALVVAIGSLIAAFTTSEEGQNKFSKGLKAVGTVVGNIVDVFADFGDAIVNAISKPRETWDAFTGALERGYNFIKEQIIDRFSASWTLFSGRFQKGILAMRIAWNNFTGDSEEAQKLTDELIELDKEMQNASETLAKANQEVAEIVVESYNKMTGAVSDFIDEQKREIEISNRIADQRAKADKIERKNTVDRAKANREIAELRFKAEQRDLYSATQRIKFLTDASKLEEEITNKEIEAARLRFEAKKAENELSRSTKEDLDEQADLEAKLIELETSKLNMQKRLQTAITTARNEEKAAAEAKRKEAEEELKRIEEQAQAEIDAAKKVALEKERIRQQEILKQIQVEDAQYLEQTRLLEGQQEYELLLLAQQYDKKMAMAEGNNELMRALNEEHHQKIQAVNEKFNKQEQEGNNQTFQNQVALRNQQLSLTQNTLGAISGLVKAFAKDDEESAKKAFKLNKAIGIAQAIVSTAQGVMNQLAVPQDALTGANFVKAGIVAATGAAQIATIARTQFKGGGSEVDTDIETAPPQAQAQAPQFNIVGQSGVNQVAQALGQQQPVQAYVVAQDVTTAQQLNNNIISSATVGG